MVKTSDSRLSVAGSVPGHLDLDLSGNWQTSHWEYHAREGAMDGESRVDKTGNLTAHIGDEIDNCYNDL